MHASLHSIVQKPTGTWSCGCLCCFSPSKQWTFGWCMSIGCVTCRANAYWQAPQAQYLTASFQISTSSPCDIATELQSSNKYRCKEHQGPLRMTDSYDSRNVLWFGYLHTHSVLNSVTAGWSSVALWLQRCRCVSDFIVQQQASVLVTGMAGLRSSCAYCWLKLPCSPIWCDEQHTLEQRLAATTKWMLMLLGDLICMS